MNPRVRSALKAARAGATQATAARLRAIGLAHGARVRVLVHPNALIGAGMVLDVADGEPKTIVVGAGSRIESGATIRLAGPARIEIGERVTVRRGSVLNVSGHLELRGDNLVSWHTVVHCAESVVFEPMAGTGEGVTVVDSSHYREGPGDHWYHRASVAPVRIGRNAWLASKATVAKGVTIGADATVAANSVVTEDVPDGCMVAGLPARVIREARW